MAKYYLLDSYSVGVESGWGSQMVGVFDSPDGCSVWCSVTLGRLIDMLPPSPPSLRLLFLHLLLQHSHCYEDGYQPPGLELQILRGWDGAFHLAHQKKMSMFGIILMTPIYHCQLYPNCLWETTAYETKTMRGMGRHWSQVSCNMSTGWLLHESITCSSGFWKSSISHGSMSKNTCWAVDSNSEKFYLISYESFVIRYSYSLFIFCHISL